MKNGIEHYLVMRKDIENGNHYMESIGNGDHLHLPKRGDIEIDNLYLLEKESHFRKFRVREVKTCTSSFPNAPGAACNLSYKPIVQARHISSQDQLISSLASYLPVFEYLNLTGINLFCLLISTL